MSLFESYKPLLAKFVTLPNGVQIPVKSIGRFIIIDNMILQDVLFVPTFHVNLTSVAKLLALKHIKLIFDEDHFSIQDTKQSKMIGKGDLRS